MWFLELSSSILFGFELVFYFAGTHVNLHTCFISGIILGFCSFTIISYFLSLFFTLHYLVPVSIFSAAFLKLHQMNIKRRRKYIIVMKENQITLFILFLITSLLFSHMTMLFANKYTKCVNKDNFSAFISIVSSFTSGCNLNIHSFRQMRIPFSHDAYETKNNDLFSYPLIPAYFTATLMSTGSTSMRSSLFIPTFLILFSLFVGVYLLGFSFLNSEKNSFLTVPLLIFVGGFGFISFIKFNIHNEQNADQFYDWIHYYPKDNSPIITFWRNFLLDYLLPNPNTLWGYTLAIWSMLYFLMAVQANKINFYILAFLFSTMIPQCSPVIYLSLIIWQVIFFLFNRPRNCFHFIKYFSIFLIIGFIELLPFILSKRTTFGIHFSLLFRKYKDFSSPLSLFIECLGILFIVSIAGLYFLSPKQWSKYYPSLVIFILFNIISFKDEEDRLHPFYVCWLPFAVAVVSNTYCMLLKKQSHWFKQYSLAIIFGLLLILTCLSGAFSLEQIIVKTESIGDHKGIHFGFSMIETIPFSSIVFVYPTHISLASTLAGRKTFPPYQPWLKIIGEKEDPSDYDESLIDDEEFLDSKNINYLYFFNTTDQHQAHVISNLRSWNKNFGLTNNTLFVRKNK